ncbi:MAG TPA: right-handed parallel beta-helix repeat-containing protein [Acidobacteriota bacterium]|nr:right-handed parallel beta-helix repeat-containing protein [Acidobacteriota bacterium]
MRWRILSVFVSLTFWVTPAVQAQSVTYYVDAADGSDSHDGRSPRTPWKSLEKVNSVVFQPGDRILFKAGSKLRGQLAPKGSGTAQKPIVVDVYGGTEKPLIAAEGKFPEALLLKNQEYWEVSNLELTNTGPTREPFRYGVRLMAWDYGTVHHLHLKNLYVHDVNGSLIKKDQGEGHGIVWENGGDKVLSRFDDLLIEGCHLVRTDRNGICGYTSYPVSRKPWFPSLRVVIRNNLLEDIGGDGIKPWGCDGAIVEHNILRKARQRCEDYAAGIWPWNCDNTLIQFNEVSGVKGTKDGQAFDSDGFCHNTVFQYNYSHDNDGGFMLLCGVENYNTVIRYNISQNDKTRLFHFFDLIHGTRIYNNVFYVGPGIDVHLFEWTPGRSGWATDTHIANNIFYVEGVGRNAYGLGKKEIDDGIWITKPGFGGAKDVVFENNVMFGNFREVPDEWLVLTKDPQLVNAGSGKDGFESIEGYKLREGSICQGAGKIIPDNGGRDFWGNPVPPDQPPSIGVHERRRSRAPSTASR